MKKVFLLIMLILISAAQVFAQNGQESAAEKSLIKKHQFADQYFGVSAAAAGMKTSESGIFTASTGVAYSFYLNEWISLNTGFFIHTEVYFDYNFLANNGQVAAPLCFTIPFGVHFNIPGASWLYTGVSAAINIPIADMKSPGARNVFTADNVFISVPVDFGFDFIRPGNGGSRLFFTVTPIFHKDGIAVPVGLVWQIYNWKVFKPKVDVNVDVPKIDVNVTPPSVNIIH